MTTTKKIAVGFVTGTLVGAAIGILFAPKKGENTRAMLLDKGRDLAKAAANNYDKAKIKLGLGKEVNDQIVV